MVIKKVEVEFNFFFNRNRSRELLIYSLVIDNFKNSPVEILAAYWMIYFSKT